MKNEQINDGGPAFPGEWKDFQPTTGEQVVRESYPGMTLRDYFAAKAMHALAGDYPVNGTYSFQETAEEAYAFADAMLKARVQP